MKRLLWASLLAIASFLVDASAHAQAGDPMAAADAAMNEGEFERAATLYEGITREASTVPATASVAYIRLGVVRSILGDEPGANAAFEWALAIDPAIPTPTELGPDARSGLDRLRVARGSHPMAVAVDVASESDRHVALPIAAHVEGAPSGRHVQVRIAAFADGDDTQVRDAQGFDRASLELAAELWPNAREIVVRATLHEADGPALVRREVRITRINPERASSSGSSDAPGPNILVEPWFWTIIGVVAVGAVVGVVVANETAQVTLQPPTLFAAGTP